MNSTRQKKNTFFSYGFILILSLTGTTLAASYTWTGAAGRSWTNNLNWSPNSVPGSADHAIVRGDSIGYRTVIEAGVTANPLGIWAGYANSVGIPIITV
ncbi:MAG: hypothetical protein GY858_01190, partial [Candidatus Omnitrophica bacterium]|nr:hypothetical protein [Candidatus Omnitrophota bacterium]